MVFGFSMGFISTSIPLLTYDIHAVSKISAFIASITGLNQTLLIVIYPLVVGLASMLMALIGSQTYLVLKDFKN